MPSKLKIKMGHIEFEYEGDAQFDKDAIKDLFTHLESLVGVTPAAAFESPTPSGSGTEMTQQALNGLSNLHINSVAAKLGVSTGGELAVAAAAHIQIANSKPSFTRKELLDTMKAATQHYNANMSSNLSKMLTSLVTSKRANQLNQNDYSLSASELQSLKAKLGAE